MYLQDVIEELCNSKTNICTGALSPVCPCQSEGNPVRPAWLVDTLDQGLFPHRTQMNITRLSQARTSALSMQADGTRPRGRTQAVRPATALQRQTAPDASVTTRAVSKSALWLRNERCPCRRGLQRSYPGRSGILGEKNKSKDLRNSSECDHSEEKRGSKGSSFVGF